jgi:hypothetical protein
MPSPQGRGVLSLLCLYHWVPLPAGFQFGLANGRHWQQIRGQQKGVGSVFPCSLPVLVLHLGPASLCDHSSCQGALQGSSSLCMVEAHAGKALSLLLVSGCPSLVNPAYPSVNNHFIKNLFLGTLTGISSYTGRRKRSSSAQASWLAWWLKYSAYCKVLVSSSPWLGKCWILLHPGWLCY